MRRHWLSVYLQGQKIWVTYKQQIQIPLISRIDKLKWILPISLDSKCIILKILEKGTLNVSNYKISDVLTML